MKLNYLLIGTKAVVFLSKDKLPNYYRDKFSNNTKILRGYTFPSTIEKLSMTSPSLSTLILDNLLRSTTFHNRLSFSL